MHFRLLLLCFFVSSLNLANAQNVSILFLGNSLTYSNDLPGLLEDIGHAHNQTIETDCLCYPNYGLEDHWQDGDFQKMIETSSYDFVIFQQGPSSQDYGRESLLEFGGKISALSKNHNAKPVYFMVWPSLAYYHTFDGVIRNHRDAAFENEATLVSVGEVWRQIHEDYNKAGLYGWDGFHPSTKGTTLAALLLYQSLIGDLNEDVLKKTFRKHFSDSEIRMVLDAKKMAD